MEFYQMSSTGITTVGTIPSVPEALAMNSVLYAILVSTSPHPHVKGQPAKRTITDLAIGCARVGLPRGIRGRLSALPTMPLDILFEVCNICTSSRDISYICETWLLFQIFTHLHPSDLLSLCRVNKALRAMLLSRNSSFLWNACLRLCGSPVSPVDMSPPAWSHLLFGGAYCHVSNLLYSELSTLRLKFRGPELWRKASQQSSVFSASSCVQVLHDNPVSVQHRYRALLAL